MPQGDPGSSPGERTRCLWLQRAGGPGKSARRRWVAPGGLSSSFRDGLRASLSAFEAVARWFESSSRNGACLVTTASMLPRYGSGRGSIPRAGSTGCGVSSQHGSSLCSGAGSRPAVRSSDRSVSGKHASSPSSQDEFESRRSLAVLAQLVEAQVLGTWWSGFESPGRYSWKANRTGAPGSPAKRCAGNTVRFNFSAFRHGG